MSAMCILLSFIVLTLFTSLPPGDGLLMKSLWLIPSKHSAVDSLLSHFGNHMVSWLMFVALSGFIMCCSTSGPDPIAEKWSE